MTTIAGLARLRPVLVVVDDLQWALPTTRRVLERLTGIDAPLLVLGTSRTATDLVGAVAHTLRGLHQDEVEQLAGGLLGRPVSPTLAAALHERKGGNPMFVRQLLAGSSGATPDSELLEAIATALPRRTIDAVREHLADLSASARRVMAAAAVIGRPERELLELLVGPCERELEEARTAGLLAAADGELSFAHALHREAAEASIPVGVRLELHDAAGRVLAQHRPGAVDEIAHHHLEAAAIDPDAARAAALAAARARAAAHAHREAADMYAAARGLVEPARHSDGEWLDVGIEHGECLRLTGDPAGRAVLWDVAHRALEVSDDDRFGRAVLCLCRLGMTTEAGEVDEPVRELAERALTQTSDDVVRAELAGAMSLLLSFDGDPGRCRSMFLGAESIARSVGDPALIGRVLPFAYLGLARREDIDRRSEIAEELVGLGDRAGDHLALFEGLHLRFAVRVQRAERGFERDLARMREIVERQDDVGRTWAVGYCSAVVAHLAGDLDEADALNEATLARATAGIAASRALAVYGAQLLGLRTDQQRLAELVPLLTPLVDAQPGVPAWRAALAASSAAAGDRATARAMVDELASDGFGGLPHDAVRSAALHQAGAAVVTLGDVARARAVVDALVPWSGRMSWAGTCTLGAIDQVLGELLALLGQPSAARRHLRKAATMGRRLRAPLVTERAERALAALA